MNQSRVSGRKNDTAILNDNSQSRDTSNLIPAKDQNGNQVEYLNERIRQLEHQVLLERIRNEQLLSLNEFSHELESLLDQPVEAQLAANTLFSAFKCSLVLILSHNPTEQRLVLIAAAGQDASNLSPNFRHSLTRGLVGRAIRARRSLINQDSGALQSQEDIGDQLYQSQLVVPLLHNGFLEGAILLADRDKNSFDPEDLPYVEALGSRMVVAWQNDYNRLTLAELVESAASLSGTLNPHQLLDKVADIARRSTKATFALVAIREDEEWKTGSGGKVPLMFDTTRAGLISLLDEVQKSGTTMRVRDIRKDVRTRHLPIDVGEFHNLLATPILLDQQQTGVILVFGKKTATVFSEQDEFLLNLLGAHAVVSIERCLLDEELRSTLKSTQLFYDLSIRISESDDLTTAAYVIGRTAFRLFQAVTCGLILFSETNQVEASVLFPTDEIGLSHPEELIQQAMQGRQIAYQGAKDSVSRLAIPIQTPRRCYGALWLELSESAQHSHRPVEEVRILINQSAVALERSILLSETRQQAEQIASAYDQLEQSYDQTLLALTNALEARDHETETHTQRVSTISLLIGKELSLSPQDLIVLKRGALLHDIGKIGISDNILRKNGQLDPAEWDLMRKHPAIGAEIVSGIPSLKDTLTIIANHHERWDGSGYPAGLVGDQIPLLARIFIVADVYDALTSHRPYRTEDFSHEDALAYLKSQSGILFDPEIVLILDKILTENPSPPDII